LVQALDLVLVLAWEQGHPLPAELILGSNRNLQAKTQRGTPQVF
jgi:hypothetical protein